MRLCFRWAAVLLDTPLCLTDGGALLHGLLPGFGHGRIPSGDTTFGLASMAVRLFLGLLLVKSRE
jgi:hypothetical protein